MVTDLLVLVLLVLVNGLFAGAEIATVTVRKTRIEQLVHEGRRSAKAIAELRANPERFLATVQVGITVVSAAAAAYGGDTLADPLTVLLAPVMGSHAHQAGLVIVVAGISFLSLVLGELVPKSLALRAGESYALLVARPLLGLAGLARPLVWLLTRSSNLVLKVFGDKTSFTEARLSPDELKAMLEEAAEVGVLHPRVGEIASRAVDLNELRAHDVMVPRSRIFAIQKDVTIEEVRGSVADVVHSRIPLFDKTMDEIVGYFSVRDAFTSPSPSARVSCLRREIAFVPESMRAMEILSFLQSRGSQLAIVVDEHGGTAGLLTREDLVEELLGEATREHGAGIPEIQPQEDGSVLIPGTANVRDVNRALNLELPETEDWTTVAGMCVSLASRIPARGEHIQVPGGPTFEVVDASSRRVRSVRMLRSSEDREPATTASEA